MNVKVKQGQPTMGVPKPKDTRVGVTKEDYKKLKERRYDMRGFKIIKDKPQAKPKFWTYVWGAIKALALAAWYKMQGK